MKFEHRHILNTSHQLQRKIVFRIPYNDLWWLATHKHALTCYVCQCHAQYFYSGSIHGPLLFFTMYCMGIWCGGVPLCSGVLVDFWLEGQCICYIFLPPCVMEGLSMTDLYDLALVHQISFLYVSLYRVKIRNFCRDTSVTHIHSNTYTYICNT